MTYAYLNDNLTECEDEDITGTYEHMRSLNAVLHKPELDDFGNPIIDDYDEEDVGKIFS